MQENVINVILGIFLTALLAAFFASIIPRKFKEREKFIEAATTFRDAFLPEITFLKHNTNIGGLGNSEDLSELLHFAYIHRHLKAFEIFRSYLSNKDMSGIDKAWKQYCYNQDNPDILFFEQYFTGGRPKAETENKKALALERIEGILKFAKHK
jgi:hypothetical protein